MSGQWPPERDDTERDDMGTGFPDEAGSRRNPAIEARLSEVSSALASLPLPALPDLFEARISAAIAAEATMRAADADAMPGEATGPAGTAPSVPARSRAPQGWRGWRFRPALVIASALACLALAIIGYSLAGRTTTTGPAASSSRPIAGSGTAQNGPATAGPVIGPRPDHAAQRASGASVGFTIIESGTKYAPATLASQVRGELAKPSAALSPGPPSASGQAPSAAVVACVLHLTGNAQPSLVDRASYAGRPAYVIAVPSRAWVVGLGCTAAHPQLVTSVSLAGLPGSHARARAAGISAP